MHASIIPPALTLAEFCATYRVGQDKARRWIANGELAAVNTASTLCGKPRWIIPASAIEAWQQRRAGGPAPKTPQRKKPQVHDYTASW